MPRKPDERLPVTQPLDESYRLIPLTQGLCTKVSLEDFEWLSQRNWQAHWNKPTKSFYARGSLPRAHGKQPHPYMHRLILRATAEEFVDHRNHDTLDNRRENLRKCDKVQNSGNRRPQEGGCGLKGVSQRSHGVWRAYITYKRRRIYLGDFSTQQLAASAYNDAAKKFHGEFAHLNEIGEQQ